MTSAAGPTMNLVASILAATATVVLALFAILQWKTMNQNNELVCDRWKREDELRAEENRPKAEFRLSDNADEYNFDLWCANVGAVAFVVTGLHIDPVFGEKSTVFSLEEQGQFVVPVGEERTFILENKKIFGSGYWKNGRVRLSLRGPAGEAKTRSREYCLAFFEDGKRFKALRSGFFGLEIINCPKCGVAVADFAVSDIPAIECGAEITRVKTLITDHTCNVL
jgi:hypothetical protein